MSSLVEQLYKFADIFIVGFLLVGSGAWNPEEVRRFLSFMSMNR